MATESTQKNPWVNRANAAACALLSVAIAYVLVQMIYLFIDASPGTAPSRVGGAGAQLANNQKNDNLDTSVIASWSLFGKEGVQATQKPANVDAPETRLNLVLQAVFISPDESRSTAMISESRKDSKLYRVGDQVPGNVSLAAVYQDKVLLNRGGRMEALFFPKVSEGGLTRSASPAPRRSPVSARNTAPRPSDAAATQMVDMITKELQEDPEGVLRQMGLVSNSGRGYKIDNSRNSSLSAMGAKPGDVILSVNGFPVGDPQSDVSLLKEVMTSGKVKLVMERNGTQFESEFTLP